MKNTTLTLAAFASIGLLATSAEARTKRKPKPAPIEAAPVVEAPPATKEITPWSLGVSAESQAKAKALYDQGNTAYEEGNYVAAEAAWSEAITHWGHPNIYYNLVLAEIQLRQTVEAYQHLQEALKYGGKGVDVDANTLATYKKLLDEGVVRFKVENAEEGAEVTLDGKVILAGSGSAEITLAPGTHALVATKPGFDTITKNLVLVGGESPVETIALQQSVKRVRLVHRWATWKPWAIVGGGAGLAVVGLGVWQLGRSDMAQFDAKFAQQCPSGCAFEALDEDIQSLHSRSKLETGIGIGVMAAGGAAVITGLVGVALNQGREEPLPANVVLRASDKDVGLALAGRW